MKISTRENVTVFQTVFFLVHSNCHDSFNFPKTQILFQQLQADKLIWKSLTCLDISFFTRKCIYLILSLNTIFIICERALDLLIVKCCQLPHSKENKKHLFLHDISMKNNHFWSGGTVNSLGLIDLDSDRKQMKTIETFVSNTQLTSIE